MSSIEELRARLYTRYVSTHVAPERHGAPSPRRGVQAHAALRYLPTGRSVRILDIGCGSGDLVAAMHEAGYADSSGIDISGEQVALAQALGRNVVYADIFEYLAAHPGECDVITADDVLEHLTKTEVLDLLDLVHASLVPGGIFLAQAPNGASPFFGNYAYGDFTHETVFTARSMRQICANAGFAQVDIHPVRVQPHGAVSALRAAISGCYQAVYKLALAAETGQLRGHVVTQNLIAVGHRHA